ncbi:hypothetical protein CPC08DRAFT_347604 [Agrocybe pediades]|nr:hypothetical protein CPC08DRAFT_347604 [Agrocybe pediades]
MQTTTTLTCVTLHTPTIATFRWETSANLHIQPGQAVNVDMGSWRGKREFHYIHDEKSSLVNDDFICTWTVSSFALSKTETTTFSVTSREKKDGAVTVPLFEIAREVSVETGHAFPRLEVIVIGISGDFTLPQSLGPSHYFYSRTERDTSIDIIGVGWGKYISLALSTQR